MEGLDNTNVTEKPVNSLGGNGSWFKPRTIKPMTFNSLEYTSDDLSISFEHFYNERNSTERLVKDATKHKLIVAFDFDNTLYKYKPEETELKYNDDIHMLVFEPILKILLECQRLGMILVLFTTDENSEKVTAKQEFCKELGLDITYVNTSPIYSEAKKPYYNILLDDRAGLNESFNILLNTVNYLRRNKANM